MTCLHCLDAGEWFDDRVAKRELERYRRRGPSRTTSLLLTALRDEGVRGRTLLDIGGGIGAIQHELLDAGAARAVSADASAAYQAVARTESERRGHRGRSAFLLGDFVEMADEIDVAGVVTLDRVVCCYPDMPALVSHSAEKAGELWGAVLPRTHLFIRFGVRLINLFMRIRQSAFRVYLHPIDALEDELGGRGFRRRYHTRTLLWHVAVWRRQAQAAVA